MRVKVLAISDNPALASGLMAIWNELRLDELASLELRYSQRNAAPNGMILLGATGINLKDPKGLSEAKTFDRILSVHCKQLFPAELVEAKLCVNLHPGFNPHGRGWYPQVFAIHEGGPAGATLHVMDPDLDAGGIIDRRRVELFAQDTSLDVYERIKSVELDILRANLRSIIAGSFKACPPEFKGRVRTRDDFKRLCKLDLSSTGTLGQHIDLLRCLTHGEFRNAYFETPGGTRIYVKISLDPER